MSSAFNWVDIVILLVLIFFIAEAWSVGFWVILNDFLSFLMSLIIALRAYPAISNFLQTNLSMARGISNAGGFLIVAIMSETIISFILGRVHKHLPQKLKEHKYVKPAAVLPAFGETFVIVSFFLTLIISFPVSPGIKNTIGKSIFGGFMVRETSGLESKLTGAFGGAAQDTLANLIIKPDSLDRIPINTESEILTIDENGEVEMMKLVNSERQKAGVKELEFRQELTPVARDHAKDMWNRHYFGHISPDNEDVGDRLAKMQLDFTVAGENLALAPSTEIAHYGLMNSEGHKKNILSPEFNQIGIGVIDNGSYGKMFVQIFTN